VKILTAQNPMSPPHDYRPALQGALSWLGKRYLLAEPLNRRNDDRKAQISTPAPQRVAAASAGSV
jgi:hypothetical protein